MQSSAKFIQDILSDANLDIEINGKNPWDPQIINELAYSRIASYGTLGLGETYMEGMWTCDDLALFLRKCLEAELDKINFIKLLPQYLKLRFVNTQSPKKSLDVAAHYGVGNDFYERMLGENMQYTCCWWGDGAKTLEQAEIDKLELVSRKLDLKPGMKLLELGSGFGTTAKYIAEKYKCEVYTFNITTEQVEWTKKVNKGLPVKVFKDDYRNAGKLGMKFDRVFSVGMMEHVGAKNYKKYFKLVNDLLKDDGLAFVHTIISAKTYHKTEPWFNKYIFPGGYIPSVEQMAIGANGPFVLLDWHVFNDDYARTLTEWHKNMQKNKKWVLDNYGEVFYRMFEFYLLTSKAMFLAGGLQLHQMVFKKVGKKNDYHYKSIRSVK